MSKDNDLADSARRWEALSGHIRMLLEQTGMGPSQFANKHRLNKSSVTRYCAGERLASWSFFELLLTEAETAAGAPLTDELRQATLRCYRNVLDLGRHPELREILEMTHRVQTLTSELSRAHYEIHHLTSRLDRTAGTSKDLERTTVAADIRLAELAVIQLTAQRDYLRKETDALTAGLPAVTRALYDGDLPVSARELTPPWWIVPPAFPTAALAGGKKPPSGRTVRRRVTRSIVAGIVVATAAGAGYAISAQSGSSSRPPVSLAPRPSPSTTRSAIPSPSPVTRTPATTAPTDLNAPNSDAPNPDALKGSASAEAVHPGSTPSKPTPSPTGPLTVGGKLSCSSGAPVTGVWMEASTKKNSRWATATTEGGVTTYQATLPQGEAYILHIGCGGTKKSWGPVTPTGRGVHTPWVTGTHNSFSCYDLQGDNGFGKCDIQ
ncbi:hypothetical protein ACFC3O_28815 [Streptomyces sp. NPDC056007]|uniref:hypothetical protein n=1 Tax=Streptomyces sp. NPDC056007 TaxID=3345678 RepID=UPI0035D8F02F